MALTNVLCIDDDPAFLLALKASLKQHYKIYTAVSLESAQEIIINKKIDLVFLDMNLGDENGLDDLKKIKALDPLIDVVMLSGYKDAKSIVEAMKVGACDYLCKPCPAEELIAVIEKNRKNKMVQDRYDALIENMNETLEQPAFIGKSEAFQALLTNVNKLKGYDASVLIEGASGTGKELLARHIHNLEGNSKRPFIAVNCAAIPDNLIESELFGHEPGAFTGADKRKIGKFELAQGGDIFLDEINSLKLELQAKLLRVLQEKEFYRVGGTQPIKVNVRVISASNADLNLEASRANFRQDLLYRLRVISLCMPLLKDRKEDIPDLIEHFLKKFSKPGAIKTISPDVVNEFVKYDWPGNVRELENLIQSMVIMSDGNVIDLTHMPAWLLKNSSLKTSDNNFGNFLMPLTHQEIHYSLKNYMIQVEKQYIRRVIDAKNGNVIEAAKAMKISRSKVYYTLKGEELN